MDGRKNLQKTPKKPIKIAVLCGGPSLERGISLNSARSVLDHVGSLGVEILPIYFNAKKEAYQISTAQLYSNTPSDFDFKLKKTGKKLSEAKLINLLKRAAITFPCIHGDFGEGGELQAFLEKNNIRFVGSGSKSCKTAFDKFRANEYIRSLGFFAPNSIVLKITDTEGAIAKKVNEFWREEKLTRGIVKPAAGGSSIGVFSVSNPKDAAASVKTLFSKRMDTRVVLEPFAAGKEFTVIILQNRFNIPVAILPTEMEMDYTEHQFFDFRKKYLPTRHVTYHCPPRFGNKIIERIQIEAEQLFSVLGMRDFARFDGFLMPDGKIWFSDFNPISGMEQNSFLFQQASRIGFSHQDLFRYIINNALRRRDIATRIENPLRSSKRKPIAVLFGGETAEKQTSLMSGTNAWLKLRGSRIYKPYPYLLDKNKRVWQLPYSYILNHTVEEIVANAENAKEDSARLGFLVEKVKIKLAPEPGDTTEEFFLPAKHSLEDLIKRHQFVFLGLHGGIGEDGTIQKMLAAKKVKFNGPDNITSALCMDKFLTSEKIRDAKIPGVTAAPQILLPKDDIRKFSDLKSVNNYWQELTKELNAKTIIAKPRGDGCSAGVVRLLNSKDLYTYLSLLKNRAPVAKPGTFADQPNDIHMPEVASDIIFEPFIETDKLKAHDGIISHTRRSGYVEMTVGVLEYDGKMQAFSPSITVVEQSVLSVEEKFQGGTGVNITPPPKEIISVKNLAKVKKSVERVAEVIGLRGYSRIDIFVQVSTGNIIVIEVNTLPGLTPSTVIFHQALAENPPIYPLPLLEKIIQNAGY